MQHNLGTTNNNSSTDAVREGQVDAYKAAQWASFAFGVIATLLALVFLRGVGVVGGKDKVVSPSPELGEENTIEGGSTK
jgi:hypothetical protein